MLLISKTELTFEKKTIVLFTIWANFSNKLFKKTIGFFYWTINFIELTILLNKWSPWTTDLIDRSFSYETNEIGENRSLTIVEQTN